jgi:hypothetical protein
MNDLENLQAEAAAVDAYIAQPSSAVPGAPAAPEPQTDYNEEAIALTELLAAGVSGLWPAVAFDDQTKGGFSQRLAPLLKKYNASSFLGKWAAEIDFGMFTFGVGLAAYKTVQASKQQPAPVTATQAAPAP